MSVEFGSQEAKAIVLKDKLLEQIRATTAPRLEAIEKELVDIRDEIEFCDDELQQLNRRKYDLEAEKKRLEKGEPG